MVPGHFPGRSLLSRSQPKNLIWVSPVESLLLNVVSQGSLLSIRKQEIWLSLVFFSYPVVTKLSPHSHPIYYGTTEFSSPISPILAQFTYIFSGLMASTWLCASDIALHLSLLLCFSLLTPTLFWSKVSLNYKGICNAYFFSFTKMFCLLCVCVFVCFTFSNPHTIYSLWYVNYNCCFAVVISDLCAASHRKQDCISTIFVIFCLYFMDQ